MGSRAKKRKAKVKKKDAVIPITNSSPVKPEGATITMSGEERNKKTPKEDVENTGDANAKKDQENPPEPIAQSSTKELAKLKEDVDTLRAQIDELPQKVKENLGELISKLGELDFGFENVQRLISRYDPGTAEVLEQKNNSLNKHLIELEKKNSSLRDNIIQLDAQLDTYKKTEISHGNQESALSEEFIRLEKERVDLAQQKFDVAEYQNLKEEISNLRTIKQNNEDIDVLRQENIDLQHEAAELDAEITRLEVFEKEDSKYKSIAGRNAGLKSENIGLKNDLAISRETEGTLNESRKTVVEDLKSTIENWTNEHKSIRNKIETAVEEKHLQKLRDVTNEKSSLAKEVKTLENKVKLLDGENHKLSIKVGESATLQKEVKNLRQEEGDLRTRIEQHRDDELHLTETLDAKREQLNEAMGEFEAHEGTMISLKQTVDSLATKEQSLNEQINTLIVRLEEVRNPKPELKERLEIISAVDEGSLGARYALPNENPPPKEELKWLNHISEQIKKVGFEYPQRLIYSFHTSLKCSEWSSIAILSGFSGTGKSELPRLYSACGGIRFLPIAVQPDWDSPQSLFGHFDYLSLAYKPTELLKAMDQSQRSETDNHGFQDGMLLVLLDEMNLARVELYFSDLLSKLETRRGSDDPACLNIDLGPKVKEYPLLLGKNVLFTGTMNNDETTHAISDKVLDRSNVIEFPRPSSLKDRNNTELPPQSRWLQFADWQSWIKRPVVSRENRLKSILEEFNEALSVVNKSIGHRTFQSARHYIANYPIDTSKNKDAWHFAFEDQFVQKIVPKIVGIDISSASGKECIDSCIHILEKNERTKLVSDLNRSRELSDDGVFEWKSSTYLEG